MVKNLREITFFLNIIHDYDTEYDIIIQEKTHDIYMYDNLKKTDLAVNEYVIGIIEINIDEIEKIINLQHEKLNLIIKNMMWYMMSENDLK